MRWRSWMAGAVLLAATLGSVAANAQTLYAASFRSSALGDGQSIAGSLYRINLGTGSATFVAPLRLGGTQPIGITGLAVHPSTGVFYGITPQGSPNAPMSPVIIDPATGNAQLVGDLRLPASDITFNRAGILFAWLPGTSQLGIVNLNAGAITPI